MRSTCCRVIRAIGRRGYQSGRVCARPRRRLPSRAYMAELTELFSQLPEDIQTALQELGWSTPTPVQAKAIPLMRDGGDLIIQAQTGSGKTGAFGIPIVECIDVEQRTIQALVMLPTRELANQVANELRILGAHRGVKVLPVYGGVGYGPQIEALEGGTHVSSARRAASSTTWATAA